MGYHKFMIIMILLILLSISTTLISPILLNVWLNENSLLSTDKILILLFLLIGVMFIDLLLVYIRERFAYGFNIENAKKSILTFLHINYDDTIKEGPSNFVERIAMAVNSFYSYYTDGFLKIYTNTFLIIAILIIIAPMNLGIMLSLLILVPINIIGYKMLNKELLKRCKVMQESTSSGWQEVISITKETDYLKQCSDYNMVLKQLDPAFHKIYGSMAKVNEFGQMSSRILQSINSIAQTMIMVFLVYDFIAYDNNPVSLVLYTVLLPLFFSSLNAVVGANLNKRDVVSSEGFIEGMKKNREADGNLEISSINKIQFIIPELKIGDKVLARNINGEYHPGDVVWVKGVSGSGKSTFLKLLLKFRTTSKVLVNGIDIGEYRNYHIRKRINYLSQNVPIIKGSLRDNLFLSKPYEQEVEEKFKKDQILQSILESKTMDTFISENGGNLSGGEKQKIALARSLYDDVDVIILDEVTSNIDNDSAKEIYKRVLQKHDDKIIFVISHDDMPRYFCTDEINIS